MTDELDSSQTKQQLHVLWLCLIALGWAVLLLVLVLAVGAPIFWSWAVKLGWVQTELSALVWFMSIGFDVAVIYFVFPRVIKRLGAVAQEMANRQREVTKRLQEKTANPDKDQHKEKS